MKIVIEIMLVNKQNINLQKKDSLTGQMSKEIKQNCEKLIVKLHNKLEDLMVFVKLKKNQNTLEKLITQIINEFKFLHDQFTAMCVDNDYLRKRIQEQESKILSIEAQLLTKDSQKIICEQNIKPKYGKIPKEPQFLEFIGKSILKKGPPRHQRHQSQLIKKGLNQLQRDILQSNNRVCIKVKELQQQIQNQQQRYSIFQNIVLSKNAIPDLELSRILPERGYESSTSRTLQKKIKIRNIQLDLGDDITAYKTHKKELSSRLHQDSKEFLQASEPKSSQTVIINKKKKQELAQLIAQQTKVIASREKYFSTDL